MSFSFANPSHQLSPYVKQYWALESSAHHKSEHIQRMVPNGLMELMIYLGNRPETLDKNKGLTENTLISGQQKRYYDLKVSGNISLFSISFLPYGAMMFFDIPLNELYDKNIPLKYIIGNRIIHLEEKLFEAASFKEKTKIVDTFLKKQLHKNSKEYELQRIYKTVYEINKTRGLLNIETLAEKACLSRKQFERTFLDYIGSSPKQFLKIVRFQNAIFQKQKNHNMPLTELAHLCGYFDQAHMINEFKTLAGMTPRKYFTDCEPFSDYFQ
ncbi:MAG: helix-turn-helix domain-containing protein [Salinivirgaceae bacterium]|jgi:AraC-like DNA-binding protein|nr:helix-turn-helix domain-containing protein [Salinivirgaceae bacterium]